MFEQQQALLFFYALFWATALSSITEFKAFDTAAFFRTGQRLYAIKRFLVGLSIANIFPIILFWVLLTNESIIKHDNSLTSILASAISSLSVFYIPRIMQGILISSDTISWFYDQTDIGDPNTNNDNVVKAAKGVHTDRYYYHIIPGVCYIIFPIVIACIVNNLF